MCCSTIFGILAGVVFIRALRRWHYWRHGGGSGCGGGSCGGGGCGGHGGFGRWRRWNEAQRGDGENVWRRRGSRWSTYGQAASGGVRSTGKPLDELVSGLGLNERQKAEATPVFTFLKEHLGQSGPRVETALQVIANENFDPTPVLAQIGDLPPGISRDLIDGLEHVHTILISEQREQLRSQLGFGSPPPSDAPQSGNL